MLGISPEKLLFVASIILIFSGTAGNEPDKFNEILADTNFSVCSAGKAKKISSSICPLKHVPKSKEVIVLGNLLITAEFSVRKLAVLPNVKLLLLRFNSDNWGAKKLKSGNSVNLFRDKSRLTRLSNVALGNSFIPAFFILIVL